MILNLKIFPANMGFMSTAAIRTKMGVKGICFISTKPLTLDQVSILASPQGGLTPAWKGIVWASNLKKQQGILDTSNLEGHVRLWGDVVVTGDLELLDRIETLFRSW